MDLETELEYLHDAFIQSVFYCTAYSSCVLWESEPMTLVLLAPWSPVFKVMDRKEGKDATVLDDTEISQI